MVPQDGGHPLYHPKYADLRTEFLKDYLLQDAVNPEDPKMSEPQGLTVNNLNGKQVTFKKDAEGQCNNPVCFKVFYFSKVSNPSKPFS